jgi:Na+/H+ antiporter NhaD/arsenite permease-like protein
MVELLTKTLMQVGVTIAHTWPYLVLSVVIASALKVHVEPVIVVEVARESRVRIGFLEYCRVGIPLTVLTLLLGWLILIAVPV